MQESKLQRPDYYHVPQIVAVAVNPHEAFVFSVVYWFAKLKDGKCFASNARISEALPYKSSGISVANALRTLEDKGFVRRMFKDKAKKVRTEVIVLVSYKVSPVSDTPTDDTRTSDTVSPTDDTGITHRLNRVSPVGEQSSKREKEKNKEKGLVQAARRAAGEKKPEQPSILSAEQWRVLIDAFEPVNPTYRDFYRIKTERAALEALTKHIGFEKLKATIEALEEVTSHRYAPKITKPTELRRDLGKLITFAKQEKREGIGKTAKLSHVSAAPP